MNQPEITVAENPYNVTIIVTEYEGQTLVEVNESANITINVESVEHNIELSVSNIALKGDSAYQIWLNLGNTGTEQDFIDSLRPFNITIGSEPPVNPKKDDLWIDTSN